MFVNLHSTTRGLNRWIALKQVLDLLRDRAEVAERGFEVPAGHRAAGVPRLPVPAVRHGHRRLRRGAPVRGDRAGDPVGQRRQRRHRRHGARLRPVRRRARGVRGDAARRGLHDRLRHAGRGAASASGTSTASPSTCRVIAGQEMGSKAQHVQYAAKGKYPDDQHIMLIGDAPGDRDAAAKEGVLYYPINPGKEKESWHPLHGRGPAEVPRRHVRRRLPAGAHRGVRVLPALGGAVGDRLGQPDVRAARGLEVAADPDRRLATNRTDAQKGGTPCPTLVDLTATPYGLDPSQIDWVEETLAGMTDEEKVGQLFTNLFYFGADAFSGNDADQRARSWPSTTSAARATTAASRRRCRRCSTSCRPTRRIPLLIAANCDSGGNGACSDGTYIASGAQCEASGDPTVAYNAGLVSGREATRPGRQRQLRPLRRHPVQLAQHHRQHPRLWHQRRRRHQVHRRLHRGPDRRARDRHAASSTSPATAPRSATSTWCWGSTSSPRRMGRLVRAGLPHPHRQRRRDDHGRAYRPARTTRRSSTPRLADEDILPATLAPELLQGLLKTQLGFNGMVITDASHMLGMTSAMRREDYVPGAIAAGCDMFLFFNDMDEDFGFMLNGLHEGRHHRGADERRRCAASWG